jgi:hypothetical protein
MKTNRISKRVKKRGGIGVLDGRKGGLAFGDSIKAYLSKVEKL